MNCKTPSTLHLLLTRNALMNTAVQGVLSTSHTSSCSQGEEKGKQENPLECWARTPTSLRSSDSPGLTSLLKSLLLTGVAPNKNPSIEFPVLLSPQHTALLCIHSMALDFLLTLQLKAEKPQSGPFTYFSYPNLNV